MSRTSVSRTRLMARVAALAAATLIASLLATVATPTALATEASTPEPPPPLSMADLEQAIALELSAARQNPTAMADDLAAATHDGFFAATLPDGVSFATRAEYLTASEQEARAHPVLEGLRWSETLAMAGREWAPYYGSLSPYANFSLAHGCARPGLCFDDRIQRARDRVDGQLGGTIEAIATQRRYAKSFVYTWWISSREWPLDSETNILAPNGPTNRGHRGIVNDHRMEAVGVGCAAEPQRMEPGQPPRPPVASCVAILGFDIADAAPNILGAVTDVSLDQLDGTTGSVGASTGPGGSNVTVDPADPPPVPDSGLDTGDPATGGGPIQVDQDGNVTGSDTAPVSGDTPTSSGDGTDDGGNPLFVPPAVAAASNDRHLMQTALSKDAGLCFESNGGPAADGQTPVLGGASHMSTCAGVTGQVWSVTDAGGGYYRLQSRLAEDAGLCLDGQDGPDENAPLGGAAYMAPCDDSPAQRWSFTDLDNGGYSRLQTASSEASDRCLESQGGVAEGVVILDGASFMDTCNRRSGQSWRLVEPDAVLGQ